MRTLLLITPLAASIALSGCNSKPPTGPGVVTITETTTTIPTTTTTSIPVPPTADFSFSPVTPLVEQVVFFDGSLSKAATGRTIVRYDWDLGDGDAETGIRTNHFYTVAGIYLVTLRVTDDLGQVGRASQPINVRPPQP